MTENFLQRWSRLKRDLPAAAEPPAAPRPSADVSTGAPATQQLPALDSLEFSSDFTAFMGDEVEDGLRRVALQKLFHAEHFNVMDGLDVYVDDYNSFEPIGEELLRNLNQARGLIFDEDKPGLESTEVTPVEGRQSSVAPAPSDEPNATQDIAVDKNP
jgi:hypothetical protein